MRLTARDGDDDDDDDDQIPVIVMIQDESNGDPAEPNSRQNDLR